MCSSQMSSSWGKHLLKRPVKLPFFVAVEHSWHQEFASWPSQQGVWQTFLLIVMLVSGARHLSSVQLCFPTLESAYRVSDFLTPPANDIQLEPEAVNRHRLLPCLQWYRTVFAVLCIGELSGVSARKKTNAQSWHQSIKGSWHKPHKTSTSRTALRNHTNYTNTLI